MTTGARCQEVIARITDWARARVQEIAVREEGATTADQ
jgi:hypothetical protein